MIEFYKTISSGWYQVPFRIVVFFGAVPVLLALTCASGLWDPVQHWSGYPWQENQQDPATVAGATGTGVHSIIKSDAGMNQESDGSPIPATAVGNTNVQRNGPGAALPQDGDFDIVYRIGKDEQYQVGEINLHVEGDVSIAKREVAFNRLFLKPGDLIDAREIRNTKRPLSAAGMFAGADAGPGRTAPRVVVQPPPLDEIERTANRHNDSTNGTAARYR